MAIAGIDQEIHLPTRESLDVNSIERELNEIWKQTAGEERDDEGTLIRARVLNLLVHVENEKALNEISQMLPDLAAAHPCRAIVMLGDQKAPDEDIEVYLSLQCRAANGGHKNRLCCEEVRMTAAGKYAVELASAATPLMVPDLPSILWWHGDVEFDDQVLLSLSRKLDRVVIDSANFAEPFHDISGLVDFLGHQRGSDARVSDLNWTRHAAWRSLIAGFFDAPENRDQLSRLTRVRIDCVQTCGSLDEIPPQGLILAGWLAACLGWEPSDTKATKDDEHTWHAQLSAGDRAIEIDWQIIQADQRETPPGCEITRVELATDESTPTRFSIELSGDGKYLGTDAVGESISHAPRTLNCPTTDNATLLALELNAGGQDPIWERSVRAAAAMITAA